MNPIRKLAAGARRMSGGDLSVRITNDRHDELGELIDDTNAMAHNLEKARAAEKQWISDTSHELQTPLAILRAQVEAIQDGIESADARTLALMHDAVMRLSQLVEDIKTLSFAGEGQMLTAGIAAPLDMSEVLHEQVRSAEARLKAAGIQIDLQFENNTFVTGNAKRLTQVIDNIIENSCRYTDAPGRLCIRGWSDQGQVFLQFDDSSPGPATDTIEQIVERFYRAETSRSRAHGGSGLGLAICRAIILAHHGTISAGASPLGGLQVLIGLPAREDKHGRA